MRDVTGNKSGTDTKPDGDAAPFGVGDLTDNPAIEHQHLLYDLIASAGQIFTLRSHQRCPNPFEFLKRRAREIGSKSSNEAVQIQSFLP